MQSIDRVLEGEREIEGLVEPIRRGLDDQRDGPKGARGPSRLLDRCEPAAHPVDERVADLDRKQVGNHHVVLADELEGLVPQRLGDDPFDRDAGVNDQRHAGPRWPPRAAARVPPASRGRGRRIDAPAFRKKPARMEVADVCDRFRPQPRPLGLAIGLLKGSARLLLHRAPSLRGPALDGLDDGVVEPSDGDGAHQNTLLAHASSIAGRLTMTSRACSATTSGRALCSGAALGEAAASSPVACDGGGGTMRSMVEGAIPRAGARPLPPPPPSAVPLPRCAGEEPGLLRAASLHGSRRAYAILPGRSRRGRGTMRSMVEGAIPTRPCSGLAPSTAYRRSPSPRLARVRNPGLLRAASLHRDPPPSLATGKGDHAQHGGGGNPHAPALGLAPSTAYRRSPSLGSRG